MVKLFQVGLALSASSGSSGLVLDPASPWIDLNKRANVLAKTRKLEGKITTLKHLPVHTATAVS